MHRVWNSNVLILKRGIKHGNSDIMLPNDLKKYSSLKEGENYNIWRIIGSKILKKYQEIEIERKS